MRRSNGLPGRITHSNFHKRHENKPRLKYDISGDDNAHSMHILFPQLSAYAIEPFI